MHPNTQTVNASVAVRHSWLARGKGGKMFLHIVNLGSDAILSIPVNILYR